MKDRQRHPKLKRTYKYYEILGLKKDATIEEIKQAYWLIIRKYHPDINKDPNAAEIAKKINEAYSILSNPKKRGTYDDSEAECPRCWTYEVRRTRVSDWDSFSWRCTNCGCKFTFVAEKRGAAKKEPATEYEEYICPRCSKPLILDDSSGLYRCKNRKCNSVFSRYELSKYYSKSIRRRKGKVSKQKTKQREIKPLVLSPNEKLALKSIFGISSLAILFITYYLIFSFSLFTLGLFIILFGFVMLSWFLYKYPTVLYKIKSLITLKYQDRTGDD